MRLLWTDALSTGILSIDEDHKAFFNLAGMLEDANVDPIIVESALNILEEYVIGHFYREEKAMEKVSYPYLSEHKSAHKAFQSKVLKLIKEHKYGSATIGLTLSDMVSEWLTQHISKLDIKYKTWLTNQNVDHRPLAFLSIEAYEKNRNAK